MGSIVSVLHRRLGGHSIIVPISFLLALSYRARSRSLEPEHQKQFSRILKSGIKFY